MSVPIERRRRPPPMPPSSEQLLRSMHVAQSTPNLSRCASESDAHVQHTGGPKVGGRRISGPAEIRKPSRPPPPSIAPPKPYVPNSGSTASPNSTASPIPKTSPKPTPRTRSKTQITTMPIILPHPQSNSPAAHRTGLSPTSPPSTARAPSTSTSSIRPVISSPILKSATATIVTNTTTTTASSTKPISSHTPPTKPAPYTKPKPTITAKPSIPKKPSLSNPPSVSSKTAPKREVAPPSTVAMTTNPSHSLPRSSPPSKIRSQSTSESSHKFNTLNYTSSTQQQPPPVTKVLVKKTPPPRPRPPQVQPYATHRLQATHSPQTQPHTTHEHIYMSPIQSDTCTEQQQEYAVPLPPDSMTTPTDEPPVYSEITDNDYVDGYCLIGQSATNPSYKNPTTTGFDTSFSSKIYTSLSIENRDTESAYQALMHGADRDQSQQTENQYYVPTTEGYMSVSLETTLPDTIYQIPGTTITDDTGVYEIPLACPIVKKDDEPDYVIMNSSPIFTRKLGSKGNMAPSPERVYASVL